MYWKYMMDVFRGLKKMMDVFDEEFPVWAVLATDDKNFLS